MFAIHAFGSEEHKQRWLPEMAKGGALGCFGLTEADSGSDPGSMRTRATRDGTDWVLHGAKMWITNGSIADVAVVWARTPRRHPRLPGREGDARVHRARTSPQALPTRVGDQPLSLDEVRRAGLCRAAAGSRLKGPLSCLNEARYGIVWGSHRRAPIALGVDDRLRDTRTQFAGRSPASSSLSASWRRRPCSDHGG